MEMHLVHVLRKGPESSVQSSMDLLLDLIGLKSLIPLTWLPRRQAIIQHFSSVNKFARTGSVQDDKLFLSQPLLSQPLLQPPRIFIKECYGESFRVRRQLQLHLQSEQHLVRVEAKESISTCVNQAD